MGKQLGSPFLTAVLVLGRSTLVVFTFKRIVFKLFVLSADSFTEQQKVKDQKGRHTTIHYTNREKIREIARPTV